MIEVEQICDDSVYLEVPFVEKDLAKAAGARWDPRRIQWYAPPGTDLTHLRQWLKQRIYLQCGFEEKDIVADSGARWDRVQGSWYITSDQDPTPFRQWLHSLGPVHLDSASSRVQVAV